MCATIGNNFVLLFSHSAPEDYIGLTTTLTFTDTVTTQLLSIDIVDDLVFEPTEHFNISLSTSSDGCAIAPGNEIVQVYIVDDGKILWVWHNTSMPYIHVHQY